MPKRSAAGNKAMKTTMANVHVPPTMNPIRCPRFSPAACLVVEKDVLYEARHPDTKRKLPVDASPGKPEASRRRAVGVAAAAAAV